jgi:hypothetical protein
LVPVRPTSSFAIEQAPKGPSRRGNGRDGVDGCPTGVRCA